jgi:hypothetical protein
MKKCFIIIIAAFFSASAYSQSIRVSFNGNRDFQLKVDGRIYNSNNYVNNDVVLNDLTGAHTVSIDQINRRGKSKQIYSSTVNLSSNEEVHLTVNKNGSIHRQETSGNAAYGYRSPMSDASFANVYRRVNNRRGQNARMSEARTVFATTESYFSIDQVKKIIGLLGSEANRLELAKLAYDNITDPTNFYQVYDLLNSQASRNELDNYVRSYNSNDPHNSYRIAMNSSSFNQLYQNISTSWSVSARMSAATTAFNVNTNYFSVAQVNQIISLISDENSRLLLAKSAIDNVVDRENLPRLFDLFYNQANKDELDTYIRSNGYATDGYTYRTAMNDDAFNGIYDQIARQWWPGMKMSELVETFNTPSNYFSTEQAKKLIGMVSSESNRVELAKLSFDNIVDNQNFRQIYDLLSSQSSKDEVDDYIKMKYSYQ